MLSVVNKVRFTLNISADRYLDYYRGHARQVLVETSGRSFAFPAEHLRPFVDRRGVYGEFELTYSDDNKFISLVRLA